MIKPKSKENLDAAVALELAAEHAYLHLATQMQAAGFCGAQEFFECEAADEKGHYMKFRDFIGNMGGVAPTPAIQASTDTVTTIQQALLAAKDMEEYLFGEYTKFAKEAMDEGDVASFDMFRKFVKIQVHSVGKINYLLARLYKQPDAVLTFDAYLKNYKSE